jgi:hypothetical protein
MSLSAIEEEVVWACSDDIEAPRTIFAGIGERSEQPVTEASIRSILLSLAERGLVQAYRYDKQLGQWLELPPVAAAKDADPWFRSTARGIEEVDDEAS